MVIEEFNCYICKKIKVMFDCPICGKKIEQELSVPEPNLEGDRETFNATVEDDYGTIICENCEKEYDYTIQSSIIGGFLYIDNLDDEEYVSVEELSDYDLGFYILENTEYYLTYKTQFDNVDKLLYSIDKTNDNEIVSLLYKLIYINIVTIMETYLSDALINIILNNEKYFDIFVRNFNDYRNEKCSLNEIIDKYKKLRAIVKDTLTIFYIIIYQKYLGYINPYWVWNFLLMRVL
jgi:transcription elongation factor Elf1